MPSGLTDENDAARICCSSGVSACIAAGSGPSPAGQSLPRAGIVGSSGVVTHATEARSAIYCSTGGTCAATAGSTAEPVAGDHTMVAPPSRRLVSVPLLASRSVAVLDSVSGSSNLSFRLASDGDPQPDDRDEGDEPGDEGDDRAANRPGGQARHGSFFRYEDTGVRRL